LQHRPDPQRSALMKSVKQRNTAPEIFVRKLLFSLGLRFRLHRVGLPGSPDIVLSSRKTVIFVHGCFWHRHPGCNKASWPKTNARFWEEKFQRNTARDEAKESQLRDLGWNVIVIWECEVRHPDELKRKLATLLGSTR
jgi:DNA mismatch endonuclease (patch repair protein)